MDYSCSPRHSRFFATSFAGIISGLGTAPQMIPAHNLRAGIICGAVQPFTSRKYKINLVRTLAYRCIRICSPPRLLQLALDDLKRILLLNGYPMGTVKYHMNDVIVKH